MKDHRRPAADRERARDLRRAGYSVPGIARELSIARSTAYLWTKDIPLMQDTAEAARRRAHSRVMTDARWSRHRLARADRRAQIASEIAERVGALDDRDLLLLGAAIYWCEGAKSKPWRVEERVRFINSDPRLIRLFMRFLAALGYEPTDLRFRVAIHETADKDAAVTWWSQQVGVGADVFQETTIKAHKPSGNRHNQGEDYHGCLTIVVRRGRELYWRIEAIMAALTEPEKESAGPPG
jgi:hypothetical protein